MLIEAIENPWRPQLIKVVLRSSQEEAKTVGSKQGLSLASWKWQIVCWPTCGLFFEIVFEKTFDIQ